jgi:hypothetical protein
MVISRDPIARLIECFTRCHAGCPMREEDDLLRDPRLVPAAMDK